MVWAGNSCSMLPNFTVNFRGNKDHVYSIWFVNTTNDSPANMLANLNNVHTFSVPFSTFHLKHC